MPLSIRLPNKLRTRLVNIANRGIVAPPLSTLVIKAIEEFADKYDPQPLPAKTGKAK